MRIDEYEIPEDLLYTKEHEWLRIMPEGRARIGITDYASKLLHEIVYVSLPEVGSEYGSMDTICSVESVKAVADIYSPVSGRVIAVNEELETSPELINKSPYGDGWLIEMEIRDPKEIEDLLKPGEYAEYIAGLEEEE